jgi:DNA-binding response OmpR family regulator
VEVVDMADNKKRILIVEDDQRVLKMLKIRVELEDYEVITARDGQEGMRFVESEKPDILLLDILLPVMNGLDLLERLSTFPRIPVIAFSAQRELGEKALKLGADAFFPKPFDLDKMVSKVRELLKQ